MMTIVAGLYYSLYLGLKNYREGLVIALAYILVGVLLYTFFVMLESYSYLEESIVVSLVLISCCYCFLVVALFIRKNGKSALSLMR